MSLVMAGLVMWGFSRTVDANLFHAKPPRPMLLWIYGAAFSTWIMFFIAQSALVRVRKVSIHRPLGLFGAGLATVWTGTKADAFLGSQGDPWDTQWDMATALIGAITSISLLSGPHDRSRISPPR